jgi:hypothetical protein
MRSISRVLDSDDPGASGGLTRAVRDSASGASPSVQGRPISLGPPSYGPHGGSVVTVPGVAYNLEVFFCDPLAPWERGAIENFNGHVRVWLPRGQRLDTLTPTQPNAAASPTS